MDKQTVSVYDNQVEEYARLTQSQPVGPSLNEFISRITPGGLVLDLGCGPGSESAAMIEHGLRADPVDASEQMVLAANEKYAIGARQACFEDIKEHNHYDGVWANFSLLHAAKVDFEPILQSLARSLKSHGYLCLGMKLGKDSHRDKLGRFYTYYSEQELEACLDRAGFKPEKRWKGETEGLAGDVEPWIVLLSQLAS